VGCRRRPHGRSPESRDVVRPGARGARAARPAGMAPRAHLRDPHRGNGGGRMKGLKRSVRWTALAVATGTLAAAAAGCGGGGGSSSGNNAGSGGKGLPTKVGPAEGQLNLIAWQGYTEDQWVKPFEQKTGCQVN